MKISIKRSGGFAGEVGSPKVFDTESLDPVVARSLVKQLHEGKFFEISADTPVSSVIGADFFHYEITVNDGDRQHSVTFLDDGSPETAILRALKTQLGIE